MGNNNTVLWVFLILIVGLGGYGLYGWSWYKNKKDNTEIKEKIEQEANRLIAIRDSINNEKQITLEELKEDKKQLDLLIKELEKVHKKETTLEEAKDKLKNLR